MTYLRPALLLLLVSPVLALAAGAWVTRDKDGRITGYSDQPSPGASQVDLPSAPKPGTVPAPVSAPVTPATTAAPFSYTSCSITSPTAEQVFTNEAAIGASVSTQPNKRGADRVHVEMDGRRVTAWPEQATGFTLAQLPRGSHTLVARIFDEQGRVLCQSSPVTFHQRQPSVLLPGRAQSAPPRPRP